MTTQSYDVSVIAASETPWGEKIVTLTARLPRFIHSEFMTHKAPSRNASSSRAIPFKTMLRLTRKDMSAPIHWGKNKPGMQASEELTGFKKAMAIFMWHLTGHMVLTLAWLMSFTGIHKQVINRMIEPWTYINVQITGTDWSWLKLRMDPAAQPEFRLLATNILSAINSATYRRLKAGEWHLPWVTWEEWDMAHSGDKIAWDWLKNISAARSARQSYTPIGSVKMDRQKDLVLADKLLQQHHLSPFEHQATPKKGRHANLKGWLSYRTELGH